ncbi:energy transducer TonB [Vibrio sp. SM6]|uniref:Protein TonB n=1 Tax=Vibrio agarilyticus TaxID=2726741 RepID=A0A7X8TP79_9VIBR|nr:energy transducer TonB [Vibrio agarilyticus]NLS12076.1 energy transducer TonB [Vibrio agarilyticus]
MIRMLLAVPFAALSAMMLFSLMAWMTHQGHQRAPEPSSPVRFDMVMVENDSQVQRRQRSVPEQPTPPQVPEQAPVSQSNMALEPMTPLVASQALGLETGLAGIGINAPDLSTTMGNQQALPLYRVEPRYPSRALKRKLEGHVVLAFTIDTTGRPKDIRIIEAEPKRVFEREAMRALAKWKYQPKVAEGKAIEQLGQTVKLEFKLAK